MKLIYSLCAGVGLALATSPAVADTTIVYGNYSSPTSTLNARGIIPWLEAITKQSDGKIKTQFVGGGAVVTTKNGLSVMKDGLIDGAFISSIYTPAEVPVNSLFVDLGSKLGNTMASGGAILETILFDCPSCMEEWHSWNVQLLGSWATPGYDLMCREEISDLDGLKGKRIRASGHTVTLTDAIGAVPANLTMTEVYEALQRNQVDCTWGSPGWLESYSLGESAKFVLDLDAGAVSNPAYLTVRRDLWDGMPEDEKQILVDNAAMSVAGATFGYIDQETEALGMTEKGYKTIAPDQAVLDAIAAQSDKDAVNAVEKAKGKGVENAQEVADTFLANYERWKDLVKDIKTEDEYAEVLKREIFSRYPMD